MLERANNLKKQLSALIRAVLFSVMAIFITHNNYRKFAYNEEHLFFQSAG